MQKEFKISQELAQIVLNYLAKQPFGEVYQMIDVLQKLEEIKAETGNAQKIEPKQEK